MEPNANPPRADNTAHLISRARCAVNRFLVDALRARGLGELAPSHGDIIVSLLHNDAMTMTALAQRINRDPSTVTTLVQKLVGQGYVAFRDNPADARSRLVMLTEEGHRLRNSFEAISAALAQAMWTGIDDAHRKTFRETLQQIIANFGEVEG